MTKLPHLASNAAVGLAATISSRDLLNGLYSLETRAVNQPRPDGLRPIVAVGHGPARPPDRRGPLRALRPMRMASPIPRRRGIMPGGDRPDDAPAGLSDGGRYDERPDEAWPAEPDGCCVARRERPVDRTDVVRRRRRRGRGQTGGDGEAAQRAGQEHSRPSSSAMRRAASRASITTPAAFSPTCCRARSDRENSATGPARVYKAGESFFEPPGSEHLVSENASATEPASLLAVFVADDGAQAHDLRQVSFGRAAVRSLDRPTPREGARD